WSPPSSLTSMCMRLSTRSPGTRAAIWCWRRRAAGSARQFRRLPSSPAGGGVSSRSCSVLTRPTRRSSRWPNASPAGSAPRRAPPAARYRVSAQKRAPPASEGGATTPADQAGQVLGNAGTALAKAQEAGVGRVEIFALDMHAEAERRIELAADLSEAIAERRLE